MYAAAHKKSHVPAKCVLAVHPNDYTNSHALLFPTTVNEKECGLI
jgi:hypothetical protein